MAATRGGGWFAIAVQADIETAVKWEGSVWVVHAEPVGQHEALVSAVDAALQELQPEEDAVDASKRIRRARWQYGEKPLEPAAVAMVGGRDVALLACGRGQLLDKLTGDKAQDPAMVKEFLSKFQSYLQGGAGGGGNRSSSATSGPDGDAGDVVKPSAVADDEQGGKATALPVDLAKMVDMGKSLLSKREPEYARKFFLKALGVLDALPKDDRDENINGSIAVILGWLVMTDVVLARPGDATQFHDRLVKDYVFFADQPMSEPARGAALGAMVAALPCVWKEADASLAKLDARLKDDPRDLEAIALRCVTTFLAGDMERCLTAALKLRLLDFATPPFKAFADAVFAGASRFLGPDHPLVQRVGGVVAAS